MPDSTDVRQQKKSSHRSSHSLELSAMPFKSHEDYVASQSAEVRGLLEQIQKEIEARIPGAERTIS